MILKGTVAPGFERVQQLYEQNMRKLAERNTQLCVYVGDQRVVDLWGSAIDDEDFSADSLVNVFSSGKSLEAIALAKLVEQGLLDYSAPITRYWPEFGQGVATTTVADLMRHEAGLAAFDASIPQACLQTAAIKENALGSIIEQQTPSIPSGGDSPREYHAITRGWIANEVFRRVEPAGRTMSEYLREEICKPLGCCDVYINLPEPERARLCNVAMLGFGYQFMQGLVPKALGRKMEMNLFQAAGKINALRAGMKQRTAKKLPDPIEGMKKISAFDLPDIASGEIPSAGAKCSARGLARLAAAMANGGRFRETQILSPEAYAALHDQPVDREMISMNTCFTQGGLAKFSNPGDAGSKMERGLNEGREGFYGWMGLGGSIFQWHPEKRIGFAYVPTSLNLLDVVNERGKAYQREVANCLG